MDRNSSIASLSTVSPRQGRSRTHSVSSDRPSTIGFGLVLPPVSVSPEPSFIAASAASQIITNGLDSHADAWYDQNGIEPPTEPAIVSDPALQLVNGFIDQLLLNFLQLSKSTALPALRPAVVEVLKPKLAKDAIGTADDELKEYLGGANEDDYTQPDASNPARNWDLELVWKRTRLRCMVYSSLGDMEEEDEDQYMQADNLEVGAHEQMSDVISPAVAIFLTSVLEYMGELTLTVAGQAAYQRVRSKIEKELKDGSRGASDPADCIVVRDADVERVALDRTLGRLWRGWKKRLRTPITDLAGRQFPKASPSPPTQERTAPGSDAPPLPKPAAGDNNGRGRTPPKQPPVVKDVQAAYIPLPIRDNDVEEIEVPGLARYSDDEADYEREHKQRTPERPKSLVLVSSIIANGLPTPSGSQPHTPSIASRKRSMSLPTPAVPLFHLVNRKQSRSAASDTGPDEEAGKGRGVTGRTKAKMSASGTVRMAQSQSSAAVILNEASDSESAESDYEDAQEIAYEKAEIMTSSRISVPGSFQSSDSDNMGRVGSMKRSSSVHSARIIDVQGPRSPGRSPAHSRPGSLGTLDRTRSVGLSGLAVAKALARVAAAEDKPKQVTSEPMAQTAVGTQGVGTASEKRNSSAPQTPSISELDEEQAQRQLSNVPSQLDKSPDAAAVPTAGATSTQTRKTKTGPSLTTNAKTQAGIFEQSAGNARAATLPATPPTPEIQQLQNVPDLPRKNPGHAARSSPKADTKGLLSIEPAKAGESVELSPPLQGSSSVRQLHTSASSVSSAASRLKPLRTSEDGSSRSESVARNFEELIQSNQTITYTLTPENMRDIDAKSFIEGPVVTRRKSEDPKSSPLAAQSSAGRLPSPHSPTAPGPESSASDKPYAPVPQSPVGPGVSIGRGSGQLAKNARTPATSTSDIAIFIKSTGPADDDRSRAVPRLSSPASPVNSQSDPRRASTTGSFSRSRYQPRGAAVDSSVDNSDLIDFIRQGPPIAASSHRIPRHVAPFRNTMDSDQLSGAGGKAVDATLPDMRSSLASTNVTESSRPSIQSSVNSKSALLRSRTSSAVPSHLFDGDDMAMPKRKTRRVRDPYAIDLSDEEDADGDEACALGTPKSPARKEESLAEFLRNCEPPLEPASPHPLSGLPRKKSSAPSLVSRLTRSSRGRESPPFGKAADAKSINSCGGSNTRGYIPIQVNMPAGSDAHAPAGHSQAARPMAPPSRPKVPMRKYEPREAVVKRSQTDDLADFLRDSAPPPAGRFPAAADPAPARTEGGSGSGMSRVFGRRKKLLAA
ncbi:uncharacterized protein UV8b_04542 [Ustilaginoidea virens]|uniref:Flo11 n=1 Tax=Ustilaginoidea virens TaxID=1159556 RepID=A0A8E5MI30_USTVR|nr:uncharacterized protein UV8b_04542 [Ustilaginoidea virens]QUC20301.1 hypothetical protein UV8b_04542 [Ustilaginoidea virens]